MNNEQFRRLLVNNNTNNSTQKAGSSISPSQNASRGGGATPALLGSRMRSSIPMTPYVFPIIHFLKKTQKEKKEKEMKEEEEEEEITNDMIRPVAQ